MKLSVVEIWRKAGHEICLLIHLAVYTPHFHCPVAFEDLAAFLNQVAIYAGCSEL